MSPRRVTLVDVAQRASVSVATVSRALSGDPQISEATQLRVRQIADNLKYVPNVAARNLVLQSSATFGLMTPDVNDPIHGQVVTGFQQQAAEHDYSVILSNGFGDADTERRALREFAAHRVAAVAVMGSVLPQVEVKRIISPSPVLFIGSEHVPRDGGELDRARGCLRPDDRDGMRQVVDHLIERGYRKHRLCQWFDWRHEDRPPRRVDCRAGRTKPTRAGHSSGRRRRCRRFARRGGRAFVKSRPDVSRLLRRQDSPPADGRTSDGGHEGARRCRCRWLRRHPVRPHLQPTAHVGLTTLRRAGQDQRRLSAGGDRARQAADFATDDGHARHPRDNTRPGEAGS